MAGSDWKLTEEGKSAEAGNEQPRWSTWDDVFAKRQPSGAAGNNSSPGSSSTSDVYDDAYYRCCNRVKVRVSLIWGSFCSSMELETCWHDQDRGLAWSGNSYGHSFMATPDSVLCNELRLFG